MIDQAHANAIQQMEHWGYYLLPPPHPHSPGASGLIAALRAEPSRLHFDPETLRVPLPAVEAGIELTILDREPHFQGTQPVCFGSVHLFDRYNREVEFLTLGGSLDYQSIPGETVYTLISPAPILFITDDGNTVGDQLAAEIQSRVSEQRVRWADERAFYRALAQAEPLALYTAAIRTLFAAYEDSASLRECFPDFHALLHREAAWLRESGAWQHATPSLEEILAPLDSELRP